MYKPSIYLVVNYLPIYETYFLQNLITKVKPNSNSVDVHPQLSNNRHPVDDVVCGCWFTMDGP